MAKQVIFLGTVANDGTGTDMRSGGDMINDNFTELYDATAYASNASTTALSEAALNSAYPGVVVGFRVFALDITLGALLYLRTPTGWASTPLTVVV